VFKEAADRVRLVRDEKERLQKVVEESESVEQQLRTLTAKRDQREEAAASATERVKTLEQLAAQATALSTAADQVRLAREEVERIQGSTARFTLRNEISRTSPSR
jgi:flagellar biosynthesis chaperone FliJ